MIVGIKKEKITALITVFILFFTSSMKEMSL